TTGEAIHFWVVASARETVVDAKSSPFADDVGLRLLNQRRMNSERAAAFSRTPRCKVRHPLEGFDVLRAAIRVSAVVDRVDPEEDVPSPEDLSPSKCEREEDGVPSWDVGHRDSGHCGNVPTLWYLDVRRQRRSPKLSEVDVEDDVFDNLHRRRYPSSGA